MASADLEQRLAAVEAKVAKFKLRLEAAGGPVVSVPFRRKMN